MSVCVFKSDAFTFVIICAALMSSDLFTRMSCEERLVANRRSG